MVAISNTGAIQPTVRLMQAVQWHRCFLLWSILLLSPKSIVPGSHHISMKSRSPNITIMPETYILGSHHITIKPKK